MNLYFLQYFSYLIYVTNVVLKNKQRRFTMNQQKDSIINEEMWLEIRNRKDLRMVKAANIIFVSDKNFKVFVNKRSNFTNLRSSA